MTASLCIKSVIRVSIQATIISPDCPMEFYSRFSKSYYVCHRAIFFHRASTEVTIWYVSTHEPQWNCVVIINSKAVKAKTIHTNHTVWIAYSNPKLKLQTQIHMQAHSHPKTVASLIAIVSKLSTGLWKFPYIFFIKFAQLIISIVTHF